ncbi:MAG TPA: hypothetical protein VGA67_01045 [Candidatus Dojkabacteria bacterium]
MTESVAAHKEIKSTEVRIPRIFIYLALAGVLITGCTVDHLAEAGTPTPDYPATATAIATNSPTTLSNGSTRIPPCNVREQTTFYGSRGLGFLPVGGAEYEPTDEEIERIHALTEGIGGFPNDAEQNTLNESIYLTAYNYIRSEAEGCNNPLQNVTLAALKGYYDSYYKLEDFLEHPAWIAGMARAEEGS